MPTELTVLFRGIIRTTPGEVVTRQFATPNVDRSADAVLLFHARAVSTTQTVTINGQSVANGIPRSPSDVAFTGHVIIVNPNILRGDDQGNVMEIFALEEFFIDNGVIVYRTP